MHRLRLLLLTLGFVLLAPAMAQGAVCADHPNQASAQAAKDTRDADGDGIYCESLSCPCAGQGGPPKPKPTPAPAPAPPPTPAPAPKPKPQGTSSDPARCRRKSAPVTIRFGRAKYRNV